MTASDIIRIVVTVGIIQAVCDVIANWRIFSKEPYRKSIVALSRTKAKLEQAQKQLDIDSTTNAIISNSSIAAAVPATAVGTATKKKTSSSSSSSSASAALSTSAKKKIEKSMIKKQRADSDHKEAISSIASHHTMPNIITSFIFIILLRILGTEYHGKIVAVLPFEPISLVRKLTTRGLVFDVVNDGTTPVDLSKIYLRQRHSVDEETIYYEEKDHDNDRNKNKTKKGNGGGGVDTAAQACSFLFIYMLGTFSIKFYIHKLFGIEPPKEASGGIMQILESPSTQRLTRSFGMNPFDVLNENDMTTGTTTTGSNNINNSTNTNKKFA